MSKQLAQCVIFLGTWGALAVLHPCAALELSVLEAQGKQIYTKGTSPFGNDISAKVGATSVSLPASTMPCNSCHGRDGLGRPEGGVIPANIQWANLSKSYGGQSASGRRFPQYTSEFFFRAVTRGLDPGGNRLDSTMPRYGLQKNDADALLAYLKRIQDESDPGVSRDNITLGTVLPKGPGVSALAEAIESVLRAYVADVNKNGGLFGRKLVLRIAYADSQQDVLTKVEQMLSSEQVFALLNPFSATVDEELSLLAESYATPVIAPYTNKPQISGRRHTFYLFGGMSTQSRALVSQAQKRFGAKAVAVMFAQTKTPQPNLQQALAPAGAASLQLPYDPASPMPDGAAKTLQQGRISAVVFLGAEPHLRQFLQSAEKLAWFPHMYVPGATVGASVLAAPLGFDAKIHLAYPFLISGHDPENTQVFAGFYQRHKLNRNHLNAKIRAYAACALTVEALKRSGKRVGRESFIDALEHMGEFKTGMLPPLSFGPGKRVGAHGIYLLQADLAQKMLRPEADWIQLR
ncbi:MAG: ABC transporter substrate-binding protein [Gammaproteobacteria bacterium]|nr:ABC transporter substrate-binding protein [Gammaproteobacteria bacterium]MDH5799956.1 ABC transporter substrate-binding protein [Gammaproteobacteria bacterium]